MNAVVFLFLALLCEGWISVRVIGIEGGRMKGYQGFGGA